MEGGGGDGPGCGHVKYLGGGEVRGSKLVCVLVVVVRVVRGGVVVRVGSEGGVLGDVGEMGGGGGDVE